MRGFGTVVTGTLASGVLRVGDEEETLEPGTLVVAPAGVEHGLANESGAPLLVFVIVVPPPIGRYYFLDLRPGRSFVEYAVSRGLQTFLISWRNPSKEQSYWDIDVYAQRILDAVDAVREITGAESVNVIGFCAGGILQTAVLNKLAASGDGRIHSASRAAR